MLRKKIEAGYTAINGHVFTQADADAYNRASEEVERARGGYQESLEIAKDRRHKLFCIITGMYDQP